MAIGRIPIFSRNFPPERNRVELGTKAKFRPTPILATLRSSKIKQCSSDLSSPRASLLEDVVTYEGRRSGRPII